MNTFVSTRSTQLTIILMSSTSNVQTSAQPARADELLCRFWYEVTGKPQTLFPRNKSHVCTRSNAPRCAASRNSSCALAPNPNQTHSGSGPKVRERRARLLKCCELRPQTAPPHTAAPADESDRCMHSRRTRVTQHLCKLLLHRRQSSAPSVWWTEEST